MTILYDTPLRRAPDPVRHRCDGLADNVDALLVVPGRSVMRLLVDVGSHDNAVVLARFCPGCGRPATIIAPGIAGGIRR